VTATVPPPPEAALAGGGLYERFARLFPEPRAARVVGAVFADLFHAYAEPHRAYHTLGHIASCLATTDAMPIGRSNTSNAAKSNARDAEIAIWWHDAVCAAGASDNEENSAGWLERVSRAIYAGPVSAPIQAILATRHTRDAGATDLAAYVVDVDLSILGSPPASYDTYAAQIRKEYGHVPDAEYRHGRVTFLCGMLGRRHLYHREEFRERFEHAARENMFREIKKLETGARGEGP